MAGSNRYYYKSVLNDIKDYSLEDIDENSGPDLLEEFDSLLSYAFIRDDIFIAGTDYLSLFNHFYYKVEKTFICSNNIFIIAKLTESELSDEAIYETLFYRYPRKDRTFFSGIKCLRNFQKLIYSKTIGLELRGVACYRDLILAGSRNIIKDIKSFMSSINLDPDANNLLSFSGGSDSMCALAMLRNFGIQHMLVSFPGHDEWDTTRIIKLSKRLKEELLFIEPKQTEYESLFYSFLTNGFSPSANFYSFYKDIPSVANIFDGYNTLFGDWSDAFLFPPIRDLLKGVSWEELSTKYFNGLHSGFLNNMSDYIFENCQDSFIDANSDRGLEFAQNHAIEFVPSRILSGVLMCPDHFSHRNFSFQLTRKFFTFLYSNNYGVNKTYSARKDYPGPMIKNPLSIIVRDLDNSIYKLPMDQGISFKDMYEMNNTIWVKMKLQILKRKIYTLKMTKNITSDKDFSHDSIMDFNFVIRKNELNSYLQQSLRTLGTVKKVIENINL